jgi:hypothetical protein
MKSCQVDTPYSRTTILVHSVSQEVQLYVLSSSLTVSYHSIHSTGLEGATLDISQGCFQLRAFVITLFSTGFVLVVDRDESIAILLQELDNNIQSVPS